ARSHRPWVGHTVGVKTPVPLHGPPAVRPPPRPWRRGSLPQVSAYASAPQSIRIAAATRNILSPSGPFPAPSAPRYGVGPLRLSAGSDQGREKTSTRPPSSPRWSTSERAAAQDPSTPAGLP